jgi:hypothetical protein
VFGRRAADGEREQLGRLSGAQVEESAADGHFVNLVDHERFAARLQAFAEHCDRAGTKARPAPPNEAPLPA